jgi:hypothetical protein
MKQMMVAGAVFISITPAFAGSRLVIDELRKLKATLPVNDPSRKEITLRLADRLADEALIARDQVPAQAEADRIEAITLYQESLASRSGESQIKIKFQLARLHADQKSDANALKTAKGLFEEVGAQAQTKELKRESFLRLAEYAENNVQNNSKNSGTEAVNYYRQALSLCEGTDSCSYAHYRLGWLERNQEHLPQAMDEMKQALWDSKGQVREESLRDLIVFMGLIPDQVDASLAYMDALSSKLNRPTLLSDLAYAYFSSGSKSAGVKVLALTHSRAPGLYSEMRLMEEYYGLRQWDQFRAILKQFQTTVSTPSSAITHDQELAEVEKIGRRLATQLDGERTTDAHHFVDFKEFTLAYLNLFPTSNDAHKVMEGLIAAEKDPKAKMTQLKTWLSDARFQLKPADEIRLRELRAAIAQNAAAPDLNESNAIVIEEMNALIGKNTPKNREYRYLRARAAYAMKNFELAAPEFEAIATVVGEPDAFAVQSQHLLLDVYNQQKNLNQMLVQAKRWTENPDYLKMPKIAGDLKEMKQIAEQAGFEAAISNGETVAALDQFLNYCRNGQFLPKSCDNAKVLSVKLSRHPQLIEVLELMAKQNPQVNLPILAAEYENGAYFTKAASLMTQLDGKSPAFQNQFKVAVLHEVARDTGSRDVVLKSLSKQYLNRKMKWEGAEEKALMVMLNDARLLDPAMMNVAAVPELKAFIAENLEEQNQGTKVTAQVLLGFENYQGTAWAKLVLNRAEALAKEADQIQFHGRNGQVAFQKRVNRLKDLNQFSDRYLSGSDSMTRSKLLAMVKNSHESISAAILASPMPAGLTDEQIAQIQISLQEMAKPFQEKVAALQKLLDVETQKISLTQSSAKVAFDESGYQQAISALHANPKDREALARLKVIFESAGQVRPAAYFEGRIQSL